MLRECKSKYPNRGNIWLIDEKGLLEIMAIFIEQNTPQIVGEKIAKQFDIKITPKKLS